LKNKLLMLKNKFKSLNKLLKLSLRLPLKPLKKLKLLSKKPFKLPKLLLKKLLKLPKKLLKKLLKLLMKLLLRLNLITVLNKPLMFLTQILISLLMVDLMFHLMMKKMA